MLIQLVIGVVILVAALLILGAIAPLFVGFAFLVTILKIVIIVSFFIWLLRLVSGIFPPKV